MGSRIELQDLLEEILGSKSVYFQPTKNTSLIYPCILYSLNDIQTEYADNKPYSLEKGYTVTVISKDPDSDIPDMIAWLPRCRFSRKFVADNLHHTAFNLYF